MIKILFLCHGNICRSPMAEFIMKDLVKKAGLEHQGQQNAQNFNKDPQKAVGAQGYNQAYHLVDGQQKAHQQCRHGHGRDLGLPSQISGLGPELSNLYGHGCCSSSQGQIGPAGRLQSSIAQGGGKENAGDQRRL